MSRTRWLVAVLMSACVAGCNQQAPPAAPAPLAPPVGTAANPATNPPAVNETTKPSDPAPKQTPPTTPAATTTPPSQPAGPSQVKFDLKYVTEDFAVAAVVHPQRILASPLIKVLREEGVIKERDIESGFEPFTEALGLPIDQFEEFALLIDRHALSGVAREMGIQADDGTGKKQPGNTQYRNNLKQLGLAFHNYHSSYGKFVKANGPADPTTETPDGLSWRVYLLPFLDQFELYQEFHLNEPWDSEHNKTLIEKMPDVYAVKGVEDAGKTSIHVFTSERALFAGPEAVGIRDITDGTSNTILCAVAGPDKAEIWTKPGGLKVDSDKPLESLGETDPAGFMVLIGDGTVRTLPSAILPAEFVALVTMAANDVVSNAGFGENEPQFQQGGTPPFKMYGTTPEAGPVIAITVATPLLPLETAEQILDKAERKSHEGRDYYSSGEWAVAYPAENTVLVGGEAKVLKMLTAAAKAGTSPLAKQLQSAAQPFDVLVTVDLASQANLRDAAIQQQPMLGALGNVDLVTLAGSLTGAAGDPAIRLDGATRDENAAKAIAGMVNGLVLTQLKGVAMQAAQDPEASDETKQLREILMPGIQTLEMKTEGNTVSFVWPIPEGFDRVPELLKPELRKLGQAQKQSERKNDFKQIGLAFHNFHDTFQAFPAAGSAKIGQNGDPEQPGLSWRVHILPYLDQAPLYNQFKQDEPWDSEHNMALIEQMPDIYKVKGIEEAGKTSVHVFTGKGAPFADLAAPKIANFVDGLSNILLVVEAGPDTAEIWTKPGGLDFDLEDPLKALGEIGESFYAVFGDGFVRQLPKTIEPNTLRKLIQIADGEAVDFP